MERIVNRAELDSADSSTPTSPEPDAVEKLKHLHEFDNTGFSGIKQSAADDKSSEIGDELDFRLFAATKQAEPSGGTQPQAAQKILLRSPSVDNANAGFIQPERNSDYYFAKPLSPKEKENFDASALTGQQIFALSNNSPWPGSAYPWRMLQLPVSNVHKSIRSQESSSLRKLVGEEATLKRRRPGKKHRIKLRTKHAALQSKQQASRVAAESKEAAEREKRTRRNREKKVKKKMRDKAKKVQAGSKDGRIVTEQGHDGRESP